jgi:hypothetical protein
MLLYSVYYVNLTKEKQMRLFAAIVISLLGTTWVGAQQQHRVNPTGLLPRQAPAPNHALPTRPIRRPDGVRPVVPAKLPRFAGNNYHQQFGHKFKHGYWYDGHKHNHWSRTYWDNRYGAYLYYDPFALAWYYWCAPQNAFYPVSYVPMGTYSFPNATLPPAGPNE